MTTPTYCLAHSSRATCLRYAAVPFTVSSSNKLIIRTSDRAYFKRCRQLWDFTSKIRMNYEPLVQPRPLEFGTAIHRGLEVYYNPETWDWDWEVKQGLCLKAFADAIEETKQTYFK